MRALFFFTSKFQQHQKLYRVMWDDHDQHIYVIAENAGGTLNIKPQIRVPLGAKCSCVGQHNTGKPQ